MNNLLTILTFSPVLGILILLLVPRDKAGVIKWVGILSTLLPLAIALFLYGNFDFTTDEMQFQENYSWISIPFGTSPAGQPVFLSLDYQLGLDGLSLALVILSTLISTMAAVAAMSITKRWKEFFILFLINEIGMLGVFLSLNLFLFFVFFEVSLVAFFFLIAIWGYVDREKAAMKFLIYNGVGSAIMLIAFVAIFMKLGTLEIAEITQYLTNPMSPVNAADSPFYLDYGFRLALMISLLIAFGIKLPIFPVHTWMLRIYTDAHPAVVMIHSAVLLKIGAYGLIRFNAGFFPEVMSDLATFIAILGVINILYGAVLAFVQKDLKMVLAYSSLSHMGIVLLGLAALNFAGLQGAIFQTISHGLISALLMFVVGIIYERTQTSYIHELGGLAKSMPYISGILLTAAMANLGLPGLSGFISEFLAYLGLFGVMPVWATIGALGIILTAAYMLRAVLRSTFGQMPERWADLKDAQPLEAIPMVVLIGFIVLIGVYPAVLSEPLQATIQNIVLRIGG
ncbi:NADH-quinone oxidoreductase subunit M [Microaerobacter geothermalis]|uniref:complex I subunit 4 family protein n=1 Tax=Microaerobacter geothermalis TaxID=674972 RepID=UPI001F232F9F|nr:NADH-quinone oxidoreductase subunit M [Microaerobacter geothermalis]MCF6093236.1 NADH-quinone oxidoreductase subunit M [Microaerobacter geothermalis]